MCNIQRLFKTAIKKKYIFAPKNINTQIHTDMTHPNITPNMVSITKSHTLNLQNISSSQYNAAQHKGIDMNNDVINISIISSSISNYSK